jgi:hypothetical protein
LLKKHDLTIKPECSTVKTGYYFMLSPQDVTEYIHVPYGRNMDVATEKHDTDTEIKQRSFSTDWSQTGSGSGQ